MPLDFPSAPAINDTWTGSNGVVYTWDGTKWTVSGSSIGPYLLLAGGSMTGPIALAADPTTDPQAANKHYVDASINLAGNYLGTWSVAANTPNISAGGSISNANYVATTVNPATPETVPVGVPGIAGMTVANGDRVIWASGLGTWQILRNAGVTLAAADARYYAITNPSGYQTAANVTASLAPYAPLASPALTGNPTAPTPTPGDNDTSIATTAFVAAAVAGATAGVASFNTRTGAVTLSSADVTTALTFTPYNATNPSGYQTAANVTTALSPYAPLASPTFTGTPSLPTGTTGITQSAATNNTTLATTAYVKSQSYAPLASPTFTGTPSLPTGTTAITQTAGNSSTALATTAFVATSFAPLAAPVFTGDARAVTPTAGDNDTSIATTAFVQTAVASGGAASANNTGRNLVHNGMFGVLQRGTGPWTSAVYTADRWQILVSSDTVSFSIVALSDAARTAIGDEAAANALQNVFTGTAGSSHHIRQSIEGVRRLAGKTVTVSFYAACTSGTLRLGINTWTNYGTGGSPSASVWNTGQFVTISTTWARYSVTLSIPTAIGKTLGTNGDDYTRLTIWYNEGSGSFSGGIGQQSGTIQIFGVQLEIGTTASALDYGGTPQQQLAACQRFYQTFSSLSMLASTTANGQMVGQTLILPVTMRAIPTGTPSSTTYSNASGLTLTNVTQSNLMIYATSGAAGNAQWTTNLTLAADL